MTMFERQNNFADDLQALLAYSKTLGFKRAIKELFRTAEQQAIYYNSKPQRSKVKYSKHQDGLAVDIYFEKDGVVLSLLNGVNARLALKPLGVYWENLRPGNRWGGNFDRDWSKEDNWRDIPHFEAP